MLALRLHKTPDEIRQISAVDAAYLTALITHAAKER